MNLKENNDFLDEGLLLVEYDDITAANSSKKKCFLTENIKKSVKKPKKSIKIYIPEGISSIINYKFNFRCFNCFKGAKYKCTKCNKAFYCSTLCQESDHKNHSFFCKN